MKIYRPVFKNCKELRYLFVLAVFLLIPETLFAQEYTISDAVNEWYVSGKFPDKIDGYEFFDAIAVDQKTQDDAQKTAETYLDTQVSEYINHVVDAKVSFRSHDEASDDLDAEIESYQEMNTEFYGRSYAKIDGIKSKSKLEKNEDGTWNCAILGWITTEDIEKNQIGIKDENIARSVCSYFAGDLRSRGENGDLIPTVDCFNWLQQHCIRISNPYAENDEWISVFDVFVRKMFHDVLSMSCMLENCKQLVIYDKEDAYWKTLTDGFKELGVDVSEDGKSLKVKSCPDLKKLLNAVDKMKDSSTIIVFLSEDIYVSSKKKEKNFDAIDAVKRFRDVAENAKFSVKTNREKISDMEELIWYLKENPVNARYVVFMETEVEYKSKGYDRGGSVSARMTLTLYDAFLEKTVMIIPQGPDSERLKNGNDSDDQIIKAGKNLIKGFFDAESGIKSRLNALFSIL